MNYKKGMNDFREEERREKNNEHKEWGEEGRGETHHMHAEISRPTRRHRNASCTVITARAGPWGAPPACNAVCCLKNRAGAAREGSVCQRGGTRRGIPIARLVPQRGNQGLYRVLQTVRRGRARVGRLASPHSPWTDSKEREIDRFEPASDSCWWTMSMEMCLFVSSSIVGLVLVVVSNGVG